MDVRLDKTKALKPDVHAAATPADATAIKALSRGDADAIQQRRALQWIVESAADAAGHHFYPTDRETAFALGRRFVGQQIVKLINIDVSVLKEETNDNRSTRSRSTRGK